MHLPNFVLDGVDAPHRRTHRRDLFRDELERVIPIDVGASRPEGVLEIAIMFLKKVILMD